MENANSYHKRLRLSQSTWPENQSILPEKQSISPEALIPGLPDDIANMILANIPPILLAKVCKSWRKIIYSESFKPFKALYALLQNSGENSGDPISFATFDPVAGVWSSLPPPPHPPMRRLLLRYPSFIARSLAVQSVAVAGHLVLVGATTHNLLPALSRPLLFDAAAGRWFLGPPFLAARRWCAAGSGDGAVYLFSGVGASYNADVARSGERWRPSEDVAGWEPLSRMSSGRFSREAVEAVMSRGKVCIVSVRGRAAKDGAVYDVEFDRWEDMPSGMLSGWRGPAASSEDGNGVIYVVDEESGVLSVYDWESDRWLVVGKAEEMKGASQIAVGGGRVCVVCRGGESVIVVAVEGKSKGRMWRVEAPEGRRVMAIHVLPRMGAGGESCQEFAPLGSEFREEAGALTD